MDDASAAPGPAMMDEASVFGFNAQLRPLSRLADCAALFRAHGWIEGLVVPMPAPGNRVGLVSLAGAAVSHRRAAVPPPLANRAHPSYLPPRYDHATHTL